jgi:LysM repeat protein
MNPQEDAGTQEDPGPLDDPTIQLGPAGRSRLGTGRRRARLIIAAAAVAGGLLAASAVVNSVAAPGNGVAVAVASPASPAEPAPSASPTPSVTAEAPVAVAPPAKAAPVKAAAVRVPAKAVRVPAKATAAKVPAKAPAKAPPTARKAAPAAATNTYTVVAGDTVGTIAERFGVDVNGMLAANGFGPYSVIVPGQTLKLTGLAVAVPKAAGAPAPVPAPAPAPAPAVRTIYVAGSGGQALVDSCIGPIHFTPTDGYSLFITEHDFCGGWARFSGIGVGERVDIPGYGSYTVAGRGQVPNPGTTNDVAAVFGGFPRAVLQTCIPGTTQMLVIALN